MAKPSRIALGILVGIISFFIIYVASGPKEPSFQGRNLSAWLGDYGGLGAWNSARDTLKNNADNAVYNMGTNAIPLLMEWFQASDSEFRYKLTGLLNRFAFVKTKFPTARERRWQAAQALVALRSKAKPAIPELTRLLSNPALAASSLNILKNFDDETAMPILLQAATNNNPDVRITALIDLSYRRQAGNGVIQVLLAGLKDPDPKVREFAIGTLSRFPSEADLVVPALVNALSDGLLRDRAAQSLGELGEAARPAVPALVELATNQWTFNSTSLPLSKVDPVAAQRLERVFNPAASALSKIDPDAAQKLGVFRRPYNVPSMYE